VPSGDARTISAEEAAGLVGLTVLDDVLALNDVRLGRLVRVFPGWSLSPAQVHAVTETRLLPARARLFIDLLKARFAHP
jgi:hypothetical protein